MEVEFQANFFFILDHDDEMGGGVKVINVVYGGCLLAEDFRYRLYEYPPRTPRPSSPTIEHTNLHSVALHNQKIR